MATLINHKEVKAARKNYSCDACEWILQGGSFNELSTDFKLTFSEKRSLVKAKQNDYKILKGESYLRQFIADGSDSYEFVAIPEIHAICIKFELYL